MTILAATAWPSNAELIEAVAEVGYLRREWETLDLTYGKGTFWKRWRPDILVTNDLYPQYGHGAEVQNQHDFRYTPWLPLSFEVVVFDPPYKLKGTSTDNVDERYGINEYLSISERHYLMVEGLREASRLTRRYVLAKCQDQVASGRMHWQTHMLMHHGEMYGLRPVDSFLLLSHRAQPMEWACSACNGTGSAYPREPHHGACRFCDGAGRKTRTQRHAHRNYSTLLVFERVT